MIDVIRSLFDYTYWARDRVLAAAERLSPEQLSRDLGSSFPSVRDTLAHVYLAEWIWYSRWQGESPASPLETGYLTTVQLLREEWDPLAGWIREYVANRTEEDLERVCEYRLINGAQGASTYREMFLHLVNHGTYHRGQVGTMLRQLGATPAEPTDLIAFFRERRG